MVKATCAEVALSRGSKMLTVAIAGAARAAAGTMAVSCVVLVKVVSKGNWRPETLRIRVLRRIRPMPVTVMKVGGAPAITVDGETNPITGEIRSGIPFEAELSGLMTVISWRPETARSSGVMAALICELLTKKVSRVDLPNLAILDGTKPIPVMVIWKYGPPASMTLGEMDMMEGAAAANEPRPRNTPRTHAVTYR